MSLRRRLRKLYLFWKHRETRRQVERARRLYAEAEFLTERGIW